MDKYNEPITYTIDSLKYDKETKQLYWAIAIGLDGLHPSNYLKDISTDEVNEKTIILKKQKNNYDERECDLVSLRIAELLEDKSFSFRLLTFASIHEYLFNGIHHFAGKFRNYNISKT